MADQHQAIVYVSGFPSRGLIDALTQPFDGSDGQAFTQVCGEAVNDDGLPGSGAAFTPSVFVASFRRVTTSDFETFLSGVDWGHATAVAIFDGDYVDGPPEVHRYGSVRRADWRP